MDLTGKHALITGGGSGIGLAIAKALRHVGAQVTITGRRADVLTNAAAAHGLHPVTLDVQDEASVVEGIEGAVSARGAIQICVANAGIAKPGLVPQMDLAFWRNMMATNLDGAFLTIRECLKSMESTDWGRVIAVSSVAGLHGHKGAACYTASKHGLVGLIRALAADYLSAPLTFNALCPGFVDTDIVPQNIARIMARSGMSADEAHKVMTSANPHGRLIAPEEIAEAALWLCGPGSGSINGQAIEISGGAF